MMKKVLKDNCIYIISFIILGVISYLFMHNSFIYNNIYTFDYKFKYLLSRYVNDNFTFIFRFFTFLGNFYIPIFIIMCILLLKKNKLYFYLLSCGYAFSGLLSFILKILISRPRPLDALINIPSTFSFPSGHSMNSLVFYLLLYYLLTRDAKNSLKYSFMIINLLLIIMICMSRLYLGVHYFSDVIGGLLFGILVYYFIVNIVNKYFVNKL